MATPARAENPFLPPSIDAARVQQDITRRLQSDPEITAAQNPSDGFQTATAPQGSEAIHFVLKDIIVDGAKTLPAEKLRKIYAPLLGKSVALTEIYDVANRITRMYQDHGYLLSRAYIPEQQIHDGVIHLRVTEGFVSGYRIKNPGGIKNQVEIYARKLMASGPVTSANLERYLMLMNDLPGVTVRSVLVPSEEIPNSAELVLTVTEKKLQGVASTNNFGNTFLGPQQTILAAQGNSLFNSTDQTNVAFVAAPDHDELYYYNAGFHRIIGSEGTKAGFNASYAKANPTLPISLGGLLEPTGEASTLSFDINHPFIRSRRLSLYGGAILDITKNKTDYAPGLSSIETKDNQRILRLNAQITHTDTNGGLNNAETVLSHGLSDFGASAKDGPHLSRANGDPGFTKLTFNLSRQQHLYGPFSLLVGGTGQHTNDSLLASEQFGMGGNEFGRGYDSSEITGDNGLGSKIEAAYNHQSGYRLLDHYQIYTFYDVGKVWNNEKTATQPGHMSLASTGVGTRLFLTQNVHADAYVAQPLTHEVTSRGEHSKNLRFRFSLTANF